MTGGKRLLADLGPLRQSPAFRRLLTGSTLSAAGSSMTTFAVTLQVYDLTRSPFAVGALGVARMVPMLAVGLLGGSIADAFDRRRLVLVTTGCLAVVSAALAAQAIAGLAAVWPIYALVAVQSAVSAVNAPARQTFLPRLMKPVQLPAALALNRLSFQVMLITGPGPGRPDHRGRRPARVLPDRHGELRGRPVRVAGLPAMPPQPGSQRPGPRAVAAGVRFIGRSQALTGAFLTDLNATVFGLPVALFPAINAERFGGSATTLGLLTAAIGVGGLVSSVFSGPVGHISRQGLAMLCSAAVWGAAFAGFAITPVLWLALVLLAVAGAADTFTVVFRGAIVQAVTPEQYRGRVLAADYVVGAGGGQLGSLEAGAVGSLASPAISAFSGGLITVAGSVALGLALPAFTRYRPGASTPSSPALAPASPAPASTSAP